jgi:hypothetical protein
MFAKSTKAPDVFGIPSERVTGRLGGWAWAQWDDLRHAAAVMGTVLFVGIQPRHWARAARTAFARQVLSIGVEPLWFVGAVAVFAGISVVVQLTFWTGQVGQSQEPSRIGHANTGFDARGGAIG